MYTFDDLVDIAKKLRSENGCPWDKEQTYESLKKCMEEECGEVLQAVDHKDTENLCEELGDVMFLLALNSQIAAEKGDFTIEDVVNGVCEKMIRRHPHVFGDKKVHSKEEELALWEQIKKQEKSKKAL